MKKLLTILIVVCLWCQNAQSDDIRDLEIEGLSIGYSLLNLFNENEILLAIISPALIWVEYSSDEQKIINDINKAVLKKMRINKVRYNTDLFIN